MARDVLPTMGRRNAEFLDPSIGLMSDCAQRWIDRNFSFDYSLKSIEKISAGAERSAIRSLRNTLKHSSYTLLGEFIRHFAKQESQAGQAGELCHQKVLFTIMDQQFSGLVTAIDELSGNLGTTFQKPNEQILDRERMKWQARDDWSLINR